MMLLAKVATCSYAILTVLAVSDYEQLETNKVIHTVNGANSTWKAGRNFHPHFTKTYLKYLLGAKESHGTDEVPEYVPQPFMDTKIPANFDARQKWPYCKVLNSVRDQGPCGSCWAVSTTSVLSDRFCIATEGKINVQLSTEQLMSCCDKCSSSPNDTVGGCGGGSQTDAWEYLIKTGVPTGGDYGSNSGCQPYSLPSCEHHVFGKRNNCSFFDERWKTPLCERYCYNLNYHRSFQQDIFKAKSVFLLKNVMHAQLEIYNHGPIQTSVHIYADFLSYKSGVYRHVTGPRLDNHVIKVIGWGEENNSPYWLAANSWNTDWGDAGYVKILRGVNECGVEEEMITGYADVSKYEQ